MEITTALENKNILKMENRNIMFCLSSKIISLLGTNIFNFALSLYILKITGSGSFFALNVLVGMLPRVVLGPFAGIIADRFDRKKLTISLDIFSAVVVLGLFCVSSLFGLSIAIIYATSTLLSTISVFYDTTLSAATTDLVRDEKLIKINSFMGIASSLSGIFAPILAGLIYGFVPISLFLLVNSLSFILSAILEVFINFKLNRYDKTTKDESETNSTFFSDFKEVINFIKGQPPLRALFKYSLITNFFITASMAVIYPYIINNTLKMAPSQFGIIEAFFSVGILGTSIYVGTRKEKQDKTKEICLGVAIMGLVLILIGLPTLLIDSLRNNAVLSIYFMILLFTLGVGLVIVNTPIMVSIQRLTPQNLMGRIMGVFGTLCSGIAPLSIIISGLIIDSVHPFLLLFISGSVILATAVLIKRDKDILPMIIS
ncbi:MAG: MFS transporter [Clostridiaceae bacterium]|nr:MFS transporter [Clostridiaceae bacterium]